MPAGADVDVSEVLKALQKIGARAGDLSRVTPVASEILVGYVNEEWDSAGRGRWPGHAPSTIKKRRGRGGELLKDTGRAAASVQGHYTPTVAEAATDVSYMIYHAGSGARSKIPLRNPFDVLDVALPEIHDLVVNYVATGRVG